MFKRVEENTDIPIKEGNRCYFWKNPNTTSGDEIIISEMESAADEISKLDITGEKDQLKPEDTA